MISNIVSVIRPVVTSGSGSGDSMDVDGDGSGAGAGAGGSGGVLESSYLNKDNEGIIMKLYDAGDCGVVWCSVV